MASAVVCFKGGANGNVPPLRVIQGSKTQLHGPWGIGVDTVHDELAVADFTTNSILVFRRDANGNVAPLRIIRGPKTQMIGPSGVTFDPEHNLIVATNAVSTRGGGGGWAYGKAGIFIFDRTANGDVEPKAIISGPTTGIHTGWHAAVYGGKIYATVNNIDWRPPYDRGGYAPHKGCTGPELPPLATPPTHPGFIGVWNITDNGDVPPRAIIRGVATELVIIGSIAVDPQDGELFVSESMKNAVFSYLVPRFFGPGS